MKNVRLTIDGAVGRITLARPEKKNALDRTTADELAEALFALSEAPVRVVAIDGDGPDFCAGADLAALEEMLDSPRQAHIDDAKALGHVFHTIRRMEKPVVAVFTGRAYAGGADSPPRATSSSPMRTHASAIPRSPSASCPRW